MNTSSTGGCGTSPYRSADAVQRVRHIGRSFPSVSFTRRWKKRAYFSSFAASSSAVSWQLSTSMNNSGTWSCGAMRTRSAWAPPFPGAFHVPVAGSGTSVQYEAMVPIPGGMSTAAWTCGGSSAS
ncbi:hypothetical protein ACIA8M_37940 [Streptomyces anulatus]